MIYTEHLEWVTFLMHSFYALGIILDGIALIILCIYAMFYKKQLESLELLLVKISATGLLSMIFGVIMIGIDVLTRS